jgi:hypothetical protein
MGLTNEEYLDTPALTVQWDLALARTEDEARAEKDRQQNGG